MCTAHSAPPSCDGTREVRSLDTLVSALGNTHSTYSKHEQPHIVSAHKMHKHPTKAPARFEVTSGKAREAGSKNIKRDMGQQETKDPNNAHPCMRKTIMYSLLHGIWFGANSCPLRYSKIAPRKLSRGEERLGYINHNYINQNPCTSSTL